MIRYRDTLFEDETRYVSWDTDKDLKEISERYDGTTEDFFRYLNGGSNRVVLYNTKTKKYKVI